MLWAGVGGRRERRDWDGGRESGEEEEMEQEEGEGGGEKSKLFWPCYPSPIRQPISRDANIAL